ncbi:hypothetical protein [Rhodococcus sp. NPDC127528]|uniref:hypothetical protein n=1 Tax=unclassified Rhodococcus (in: high G+C Gram-positive bacteria) TaxID=192944 RepID=UPI0036300BF0
MSTVTRVTRIVAATAGSVAVLAASAAIATAAPAAPGAERFTPLADGSHTEFLVNPVLNQDDLFNTNKDLTTLPDVRAHSIDGRSFSFYRVVDGVRIGMVRVNEFCLPTGVCHGLIVDNPTPVI